MKINRLIVLGAVSALLFPTAVLQAQDLLEPGEVENVRVSHDGADVFLSWAATETNKWGGLETTDFYKIYRGTTADVPVDTTDPSTPTSSTSSFTDPGAIGGPNVYYYLVSAVDTAGQEGNARVEVAEQSKVVVPPTLAAVSTQSSVDLTWTQDG